MGAERPNDPKSRAQQVRERAVSYARCMDFGERATRVPYFPMIVDEEFEQERKVVAFGQLGELSLIGSTGVATATREPMVVVAAEIPILARSPATKADQEFRDLFDFARREVPGVQAEALTPGPDPNSAPDAVLTLRTGVVRLEAAQIHVPPTSTMGTNMHRWAAFEQVRSSLLSRSAVLTGALRHHRGSVIYVWFMDPASRSPRFTLPPRKDPTKGLVDTLLKARPSAAVPDRVTRSSENVPSDAVAWSNDHSVGVSWGELPADYQSSFMRAFGFELGLGGSVSFRRSDVRAELRRIIEQHDTNASDVLVVSANSALRSGLYFPSTQLVSEMLFADQDPLQGWAPRELRGVALHDPRESHEVRWLVGQLS